MEECFLIMSPFFDFGSRTVDHTLLLNLWLLEGTLRIFFLLFQQ